MKVLFCTDGSQISFAALNNFAKWGRNSIIDVICIIDWSFLPNDVSIETEGFTISCANIADNILDYAEREIKDLGLLFGEKFKECGGAVECILERVGKGEYDLILMGSHGKKGIQKWLGSVSRDIVYNGNISTYITKSENAKKKVLFTTDGTETSNFAITEALYNLDLEGKKIYICTVNENPDLLFLDGTLDTNWLLAIEQQQEIYSQKTIALLKERIESKGLQVEKTAIMNGNPAQKIIDFSKSENIDLIVAGAKDRTKMQDFLLGSVSKRILENSQSDVLIFKEKNTD